MPQVDRVEVRSITDGDTLTMALQAGQLDAVQGLPYASLELFCGREPVYHLLCRYFPCVFRGL